MALFVLKSILESLCKTLSLELCVFMYVRVCMCVLGGARRRRGVKDDFPRILACPFVWMMVPLPKMGIPGRRSG